jgi:signal transduction histidine kinase
MSGSPASRRWLVPFTLVGCGLAVCGWQLEEHVRYERSSKDALIKRGRDITSTLGVVLRSQRWNPHFGIVSKERVEPALQALVQLEGLESISILSVTGEPLAGAGRVVDLGPDVLMAGGAYWGRHTLTVMNLMDLGSGGADDASGPAAAVVSVDQLRRRSQEQAPAPGGAETQRPDGPQQARSPEGGRGGETDRRPPIGRSPWMTKEEYEALIHKNGAHSLVISLSTDEMRQKVWSDLVLRSLVSFFALGGAVISSLAWRNSGRNAELQIRLVKAGEMNAHLKEMNFAAAGLAHETRNPLNLIRGLAQMITMQAESSPALREHATKITEEADRVTVQLNEFINYSKPREAHLAPVELKRLVADVVRTLMPDFEEKQIRVVQPEMPCVVEADEALLRQALFNVFLNASQAVGQGGEIRVRATQVGPREAVMEIADDGPGVPAADRENIFKPYVTMRQNGVGLGLAIVRQIAAAHRWEVVCDANEPRGAVFRFSRIRLASA